MALIGYRGGLLGVNGQLTDDPNCCCIDDPPDVCPPCCLRIAWGTFDDDGNLIGSASAGDGATVHVKITPPTPGSRTVCNDNNITIQWTIENCEGTGSNGAWIRYGAAWSEVNHSPGVNGDNGKVYDRGLIDWGTIEDDSYSATIKFSKCFLDVIEFLGYVVIGMDYPAFELEIDFQRCETPDWCCREDYECEDCCALLEQNNVVTHGGKYYVITDTPQPEGHFALLVEFELSDPGKICVGDGIDITAYLIPPRHSLAGDNNMVANHPKPWKVSNTTPAIAADGSVTDDETDWGTLSSMEYSISLSAPDCNGADCEGDIAFPPIQLTSDTYGSAFISFDPCDLEDCCCPNLCSCHTQDHPDALRCFWPVGEFDCTTDGQFTELGGPTQVINFTSTVTANSNVFCGNTTNSMTWTQSGTSTHLTMCEQGDGRKCYRSRYAITFPAISSCGAVGSFSINFVGFPCMFNVGLNGVSYQWWTVLATIQVSDCKKATVTRTVTQGGVTYTYTTTFELVGPEECPCDPPPA